MFRNPAILSIILLTSLLACSGTPEEAQQQAEQPLSDQAEGETAAPVEAQPEASPAVSSPPADWQEELQPEPAAVQPPPPPEPETGMLPAGTVLEVRLAEPISTRTNRDGDELAAILDRDLKINGKVAFPQGTKV